MEDAATDTFVADTGQDAADAGVDAPGDTALPDVGVDTGSDAGPAPCEMFTVDLFELAAGTNTRARRVHVSAGADRFIVSWAENRLGQQDVFARVIPEAGSAPPEAAITDSFDRSEQPASLDVADSAWLAYYDNREGNFEIYFEQRMADLSVGVAAQRLTTNTLRDEFPLLTRLGTGALISWIETDSATTTNLLTQVIGADGVPVGTPTIIEGDRRPSQPRISPWGDGAILAFTEPRVAGGTDAYVLLLSSDGSAVGTAFPMSSDHDVTGGADVTENGSSGGLYVFDSVGVGVRKTISMRPLNSTGRPRNPEPLELFTDQQTANGSVAAFGEGFVVAHRLLGASPKIRVSIVDVFGRVLNTIDIADASAIESPTYLEVSPSGALVVGWADVSGSGTNIRAGRLLCAD